MLAALDNCGAVGAPVENSHVRKDVFGPPEIRYEIRSLPVVWA